MQPRGKIRFFVSRLCCCAPSRVRLLLFSFAFPRVVFIQKVFPAPLIIVIILPPPKRWTGAGKACGLFRLLLLLQSCCCCQDVADQLCPARTEASRRESTRRAKEPREWGFLFPPCAAALTQAQYFVYVTAIAILINLNKYKIE